MTNPSPVAPIEGHYALLRNGLVARPVLNDWPENPPYSDAYLEICWYQDGTAQPETKADLDVRSAPLYDIIATISPADMQAVASGELERLRAALKAHEVQWNRLQDAITGMEKTMEAHGIDYFKWRPMTFDETLKRDAP